jgi:biotin carboxyl carrier protein
MKLQAELNSEKHEIEIRREAERLFAKIDGREYELEASEPEPNVYLLKNAGRIYEIFVSPSKNAGDPLQVKIGTNEFEITLTDPKRLRSAGAAGAAAEGAAEIKTAMPGKVVRVLAELGAEIKQGEGVIVVEAMKMQNEMKSPKDGTIKEIRFSEGETVNAGDVLAVIE